MSATRQSTASMRMAITISFSLRFGRPIEPQLLRLRSSHQALPLIQSTGRPAVSRASMAHRRSRIPLLGMAMEALRDRPRVRSPMGRRSTWTADPVLD